MTRNREPELPASTFGFAMTDLEEKLSGKDGHEVKSMIAARLSAKATELRKLMESGLEPETFEKVKRAHTGLAAAYDIIKKFPAKNR